MGMKSSVVWISPTLQRSCVIAHVGALGPGAHVEELPSVALAAEHGVEQAHGQPPLLGQPHEGKSLVQPLDCFHHHVSIDRHVCSALVAVHHLDGAAGDQFGILRQRVVASFHIVAILVIARNNPLLGLAEHRHEILLVLRPTSAFTAVVEWRVTAANCQAICALLAVLLHEAPNIRTTSIAVGLIDDVVIVQIFAPPTHQRVRERSPRLWEMQPAQLLGTELCSAPLRGSGWLHPQLTSVF